MNDDALVEERVVDMVEYNQACMTVGGEIVLSAIEQPMSKSEFLSFDDKYNSAQKGKQADRIIPADISQKLEKEINETTRQIYSLLNLEGIVRIDYIYDNKKKKLYFNEVNTIPGSMASGRSYRIIFAIYSKVKGSIYTLSAIDVSVIIVAGFELHSTTSYPSSLSARQACVPA